MPADPGAALRAAALPPRRPLDTAAVLRRAHHLRARRRAGLALAALAVVAPLLVLPLAREGVRFTSPDGGEAMAERACTALEGPRVPNENRFVALGLSDELPRRLVEQTTVVADRCVVDARSGAVIGAALRLEDEAAGVVAIWLLLPSDTQRVPEGLVSWLLETGPEVGEGHVVERHDAVAIVSDPSTAILAGDPSEPQQSAWGALVRAGGLNRFAAATVAPRFTRPTLATDSTGGRDSGLGRDSRLLPTGFGTRLRLPSGRALEVVLPAAVQARPGLEYRPESVGIVDDDGGTPRTSVTTSAADEVGRGLVSGGATRLPNGALQEVWRGGMSGDPLVTATLDDWTLVLDGPDGGLAERIVAALDWSVDADGFLLLASTDEQVLIADAVALEIPTTDDGALALSLAPGCESAGDDLERFPGLGVWCADGFTVVAQTGDGAVLEALYEQLRVFDAAREDAAGELTLYRDPAAGLQVTYPPDWSRAAERLTPNLGGLGGPGELVEVLTIGTGALLVGGDVCAQVPERAVEALGPGAALVTVQERVGAADFPARPATFGAPDIETPATLECFANADEVEHVRYDFADGGRGFSAYVTMRQDATARVRSDALAILDGLAVDPR